MKTHPTTHPTTMSRKAVKKAQPKKRVNEFQFAQVLAGFEALKRAYHEAEARIEVLKTVADSDTTLELDGEHNPVMRSAAIVSRLSGNLRRSYEKILESK